MLSDAIPQPLPESDDIESKGSVLIIEDDPSLAEVLSIRLKQQGYRTFTAQYGHEGLRLARQYRPNLVLLDLRLPDVDGFQIGQDLDEDPLTCMIPKIVVSGMERPDIVRRTRSSGCQYYVRKPYDPNALLILIERAIEESEENWS